MRDVCTLALTGRVVADGKKKDINGLTIVEFDVAVNYAEKRGSEWKEEVSFLNCVLFGKYAETLSSMLRKGVRVSLSGEIRQKRWETEGGEKRSRVMIYPDTVVVLDKPQQQSESRGGYDDEDVPF